MASQPACYIKLNNAVAQPAGWSVCGVVNATTTAASCCQNGDYCLQNGLCQYTRSSSGGSGFYVAGCTDGNYKAASCPPLCNDLGIKDVTYQSSPSQLWKCCGTNADGSPDCDKPTNQNFNAPRPDKLDTTYQANVGTVTAQSNGRGDKSQAAATTTSSPSASPTPKPPPGPPPTVTVTSSPSHGSSSGSHRISSAAAGGIGAAGAAALLMLGALLFLLHRRRRRTTPTTPPQQPPPNEGAVDRSYPSSGRPGDGRQRYDSMRNASQEMVSPWTPAGAVPAYYDRKESNARHRPPTELYAEHAVEMGNDGMITPVTTRVLDHEMSTESMRPTTAEGKGKAAWA